MLMRVVDDNAECKDSVTITTQGAAKPCNNYGLSTNEVIMMMLVLLGCVLGGGSTKTVDQCVKIYAMSWFTIAHMQHFQPINPA